jgi:uncharacterized protein (DUF433 family)
MVGVDLTAYNVSSIRASRATEPETMSTETTYPHIEKRADGQVWLIGTQTKVLEVALDRLAHHWDADEIQRQHPHLTLAQIHSCLTYYYDHQEEIDQAIEDQLRAMADLRRQQGESIQREAESPRACLLMLALYMDHHVPSAITAGLRQRGIDVLTAQEDGSAALDDERLLDRETSLGRVLFSQDADLLSIASRRSQAGPNFAGVVYAHQLGITIGEAIRDLELITGVLEPDDMHDRVEYLPY